MIKKILISFIIWRIFLFALAYLSPSLIPTFGAKFPYYQDLKSTNLPHFVWSFANFDGVHYLRNADKFYDSRYSQTFFPLYSILIKVVSPLTLGSLIVSDLIISNLAFAIGLILFYKLTLKVYDQSTAFWSCLFLLFFPTSFYFGAVYTEGLFFLLIILAFYLYENGQMLAASAVGSLSSATRLVGVLLAPAFIKDLKIKNLFPLAIIPLGLAIYMIYLKVAFDNPFYFLSAQSIYAQQRSTTQIVLLPQVFWRYLKILASTTSLTVLNSLYELSSTIFAILFLILGTKVIKREWLIFSWLAIITPTLTGTLVSMPRYILVAFPIFIVLARIKSTFFKIVILISFLLILSISVVLFTQGYWVA